MQGQNPRAFPSLKVKIIMYTQKITYTLVHKKGSQRYRCQPHVTEDTQCLGRRCPCQQDCKGKEEISCRYLGAREDRLTPPGVVSF